MDRGSLTVAIKTFGCKVNRVESEDVAAELLGRGVRLVAEEEAAVIVINTCTVTGEADRKARKAVRHALSLAHEPIVVATGCLATTGAESLTALGERVVVESDREQVSSRVAELLGAAPNREIADLEPVLRVGSGFRTRAAVKVADGCDAYCAYCIVPFARGLPRSTPLIEVVSEVERLVAAGIAEVVLTGINLGRYADSDDCAGEPVGFAGLIRAVGATGVPRIRISSIEPLDLDEGVLRALAETPAVCPHLHVPLQSGSDRLLRAMGRSYTRALFAQRIASARDVLPGLAVTTDVMAGFPGETKRDADETLSACEELAFSRLHVFRYSKREGTRAASMHEQVPTGVASDRAAELRALDLRLRERYADSRIGGKAEVLLEQVDGSAGPATGTTEDYLSVRVEKTGRSPGEVVPVRLVRRAGDVIVGEELPDVPGGGPL